MQAIVLFARSPEREAAAKGMPSAAPLFARVTAAWLRAARRCGVRVAVACDPCDRHALAAIAPEVARQWIDQPARAFGGRVAAVAAAAFEGGLQSILIAAIDAPPPPDLRRALALLRGGTPVVAPARDGGVNFIGLVGPEPGLLAQFAPCRTDLVALCTRHLQRVAVFEMATDIDGVHALAAARRERAWHCLLTPRPDAVHRRPSHVAARVVRVASCRPPPAA
jgi:glycosyltransferase A (GT-A) superfamily protein (DUF2064 family)